MTIHCIRACLFAGLLAWGWAGAEEHAAQPVAIHIEAQSIRTALQQFGAQTGLQVSMRLSGKTIDDVQVPALAGKFTAKEGLERLLANTGLRFEFVNERSVRIIPVTAPVETTRNEADEDLRLVQVADGRRERTEKDLGSDAGTEHTDGQGTPEILVKGTRSLNTDIRRTEDDPQPYVVFDRKQIERSMAGNLEDFLKTRLPMNTVSTTNEQSVNLLGNQSEINLRGLGANQTLILVDGRQLPSVQRAGTFAQPDINGIPLAAIERIEVLPSTASGIYGGGATGGVVNIITRKDYSGATVGLRYDDVFEGGAGARRIDASFGFKFDEGRTSVTMSASYADSDPLLVGDRDFVARARALQLANNSTAFLGVSTPPVGATTNIRSANGSNLILDNGTPLNSPRTFVPVGYIGGDAGMALVANAGRYNLDLPDDANGRRRSLVNNPTTNALSFNLRRQFGTRVEAFIDASRLTNQGSNTHAIVTQTGTVAANAPNNPFTTLINVAFPSPGPSYISEVDTETLRVLGGAILRLPADWTVSADYAWSRGENDFSQTSAATIATALSAAVTNGTLNVLRDLNAAPPDFSPFLLPSPNDVGSNGTELKDMNLRVSGGLFRMPGGPLTISAFAQHRKQEGLESFRDTVSSAGTSTIRRYFPARFQTVDSYYLETRVPVISDDMSLPLVRELSLQASVRSDEFRVRGPTPNFVDLPSPSSPTPAVTYGNENEVRAQKQTFGLRWSPVEDLALRASFGTGFLPPSIDQIVPIPVSPTTATVVDPKRGAVSTTYQVLSGRVFNPDLVAEESKSWSMGAIFTPRFLEGLRLSVDYTHIKKNNEITFFNFQNLVNVEDYLPPGRIVRDPLTAQDAALGYTGGVITAVDASFVNLAATEVKAYDLQLDYTLSTGRGNFIFYAVATYMPQFERRVSPAAPAVDSAGFSSGQLEWRGNGGVSWEHGAWTLGWDAQYYDAYYSYAGNATAAVAAAAILNQGSAIVPTQQYHDAFARYAFGADTPLLNGAFKNVELRLRVQNVFDKSPPILVTTGVTGGYSTYGNPRLRRYSLSLTKSF